MSMTKSTFMKLPEGEKAAYVLSSGRQITTKRQGENFANLFSVEDFLVEVLFDADKNQIISIDIIEDSDVIDSYIDAGLLK
jgi:hypothetical protein